MFNIKPVAVAAPVSKPDPVDAKALKFAALAFAQVGQINNSTICHDMAMKLARYGSFVSDKQASFAASLVQRAVNLSKPVQAPAAPAAPKFLVPDLFAVMQKHSKFYLGDVTLSRKNQDSLVWIKHVAYEGVIGKIADGVVTLYSNRLRVSNIEEPVIEELLNELEANPLAAAIKYGKLAGRCCSCGRDLTDEGSIEAGIGPVCALKFS